VIAEAIKSKVTRPDTDIVSELVAKGEIELGMVVMTSDDARRTTRRPSPLKCNPISRSPRGWVPPPMLVTRRQT
jgi:hypothetical protein